MDNFDIYYRTAQERLQSQERLARDYGIKAFQLVTVAGVVLLAGLEIFDFPDKGDTTVLAALAVLGVAVLLCLYAAWSRGKDFPQECRKSLQGQEIRARDRRFNILNRPVVLPGVCVVAAGIGFAFVKILLLLALAVGLGAALVPFANSEGIDDLPIVEVLAVVGLFGGFSFTALLAGTSVFGKRLSRGPTATDLAEEVDKLAPDSYLRSMGDSYTRALETNEEVLSDRDRLLLFAAICLVVEIAALLLMASNIVFGR